MRQIIKKFLPQYLNDIVKSSIPNKTNSLIKNLKFNHSKNIIYLGTDYGGWSILNGINIENKFVISAGLGEDASFDIELISKYNCKILVVDPTPRAIEDYNEIIKNSGKKKVESYKKGGKQNVSSYDLSNINRENFILVNRALYDIDNKDVKFFAPSNKNHVSYSINNWQNNYKQTSDFIKVKTITVKSILDKFNISNLEMIKLDIEGSEIEVLKSMIDQKIFPNQILVEFDELIKINKIAIDRFKKVHQKLLSENYKLIKTDNEFPNFLYVR